MSSDRIYLELLVLKSKATLDRYLAVSTQPYIEDDFGNNDNRWEASNGFYLGSNSCLEITTRSFLYLRGCNFSRDFSPVMINEEMIGHDYFGDLRLAVREYNIFLNERYDKLDEIQRAIDGLPVSYDYTYTPSEEPGVRVVRVIL